MKSKTFLFVAMFIFASATTLAQSEQVHKIEKGETVESIAQKYGVTVDDIKKANPNAGNYFYVGMSLKIPRKVSEEATTEGNTAIESTPVLHEKENTEIAGKSLDSNPLIHHTENVDVSKNNNNSISKIDPYDFGYWGFTYNAPFENADLGAYYIEQHVFHTGSGWGVEWGLGANYGLVDSDYAGILFKAGVTHGWPISEKVLFATSFCFDGSYSGTGKYIESGYSNSNASWGGQYYEVERSGDQEFYWGFSLRPKIIFKAGKIYPNLGLMFSWMKDAEEISVGFTFGIGF